MRINVLCFAVAAGVVGVASLASAVVNTPGKANKFQSTLVGSYVICTAPTGNSTKTLPLPACDATPSDPCSFDPTLGGKGSVKATVSGATIKLSAKVKGLNAACEGKTLNAVSTARVTSNDCTTPPCTVVEAATKDFPTGCACGPVASGACSCSSVVGPGVLTGGASTNIQLMGCALEDGSNHAVDCGLLIP